MSTIAGILEHYDSIRQEQEAFYRALHQHPDLSHQETRTAAARGMLADGLADAIPRPDIALAQHVLIGPAGTVSTRVGAVLSSADSVRITVHGRGSV